MIIYTESLDIKICDDFLTRFAGLRGIRPIGPRQSAWLVDCWCVHTFGMRENLSLLYLDGDLNTIDIVLNARPHRVYGNSKAHSVIETGQRTPKELFKISEEISSLADVIDLTQYAYVGRIKTRVQDAAKQNV